MAWVRTVQPAESEGEIREAYRAMHGDELPPRAANVISSTSIRPRTMLAMARLNDAVNFRNDDSGVTRQQREMIATVVSVTLKCRY